MNGGANEVIVILSYVSGKCILFFQDLWERESN